MKVTKDRKHRVLLLEPRYHEHVITAYHPVGEVWACVAAYRHSHLQLYTQRRHESDSVLPIWEVTLCEKIPVREDYRLVFQGTVYAFVSRALNPGGSDLTYYITPLDEAEI
ncbi:MAG: hypothetical protein H6849_00180 [Alphaproteobacteria bacterium]|nr:MAG: hypothetical protein H6849_00180 [Alphaproteobacteria bacterium]